jgi:hypothetical protein
VDRGSQGGARTDETECADFSLLVAVFAHRGYTGNRVLEEYRGFDFLQFVVRYQLRLVVCAYRSIQVATLAHLEQKT